MAVSPEESMVLYHGQSQRRRTTRDGKPNTTMGTLSFEAVESIRLPNCHWMVHAVVHIQQFINKRNVKYKPYGPWGHFPKEIFGTILYR